MSRSKGLIPTERYYHKEYSCDSCWYPRKGLDTKNTLVKYQSSRSQCSKISSKVIVFRKKVKLQCKVTVKNNGIHRKVLKYQNASTRYSKVISKYKVFKK